jgi:predicted site-specific integrase-resolvase
MKAMTVEQFGERLGISRTSAYRLVRTGAVDLTNIAPTTSKPRLRITEAAYERFLSKREIKGRAA